MMTVDFRSITVLALIDRTQFYTIIPNGNGGSTSRQTSPLTGRAYIARDPPVGVAIPVFYLHEQ